MVGWLVGWAGGRSCAVRTGHCIVEEGKADNPCGALERVGPSGAGLGDVVRGTLGTYSPLCPQGLNLATVFTARAASSAMWTPASAAHVSRGTVHVCSVRESCNCACLFLSPTAILSPGSTFNFTYPADGGQYPNRANERWVFPNNVSSSAMRIIDLGHAARLMSATQVPGPADLNCGVSLSQSRVVSEPLRHQGGGEEHEYGELLRPPALQSRPGGVNLWVRRREGRGGAGWGGVGWAVSYWVGRGASGWSGVEWGGVAWGGVGWGASGWSGVEQGGVGRDVSGWGRVERGGVGGRGQ